MTILQVALLSLFLQTIEVIIALAPPASRLWNRVHHADKSDEPGKVVPNSECGEGNKIPASPTSPASGVVGESDQSIRPPEA